MSGFLFSEMVFGPVRSRRLGNSLGINLLPATKKVCTFDCVYCECGWTLDDDEIQNRLPSRHDLAEALESKLINLQVHQNIPDSITFAGNGEPTIHPDFPEIIEDTVALRDKFFPATEITVLSNSSTLHKQEILQALKMVDNNVLKLDAGLESTFQLINRPRSSDLTLFRIVNNLRKFGKKVIIQTLFLTGEIDGKRVDNTTTAEVHAWLGHIRQIKPRYVMLYSIDRPTPASGLQIVPRETLMNIAEKLKQYRIKYSIY